MPVVCPHCDKTFTRKDNMKRHIATMHAEEHSEDGSDSIEVDDGEKKEENGEQDSCNDEDSGNEEDNEEDSDFDVWRILVEQVVEAEFDDEDIDDLMEEPMISKLLETVRHAAYTKILFVESLERDSLYSAIQARIKKYMKEKFDSEEALLLGWDEKRFALKKELRNQLEKMKSDET